MSSLAYFQRPCITKTKSATKRDKINGPAYRLTRLESNGLSTSDVKAEALKGKAATDALRNGKVDAIFVVAGYPTGAIVELASAVDIKLVPIDGAGAKALTSKYGFFSESPIPSE